LPISCRKGASGVSRKSALPQVARGVCCRKSGWSEQILILRLAIESPRRARPDDANCIQAIAPLLSLCFCETPTFSAEVDGRSTAKYSWSLLGSGQQGACTHFCSDCVRSIKWHIVCFAATSRLEPLDTGGA
jgi:hypothetical protein